MHTYIVKPVRFTIVPIVQRLKTPDFESGNQSSSLCRNWFIHVNLRLYTLEDLNPHAFGVLVICFKGNVTDK